MSTKILLANLGKNEIGEDMFKAWLESGGWVVEALEPRTGKSGNKYAVVTIPDDQVDAVLALHNQMEYFIGYKILCRSLRLLPRVLRWVATLRLKRNSSNVGSDLRHR